MPSEIVSSTRMRWRRHARLSRRDPNEGRAHHALATIQLRIGNIAEAPAGYLRALDLAPSLAEAAWDLSVADAAVGRLDESLFWARRGFVLAPNASMAYYHVAVPLAMLGDSEATQRWLRGGEERFPRSSRIQYMLAGEEYLSGNLQAAEARVRRALAANPNDEELKAVVAVHAFLIEAAMRKRAWRSYSSSSRGWSLSSARDFRTMHAYHLLKRGDTQRATALMDESLGAARKALDSGGEDSMVQMEIAAIHAARGERVEALRWLEAAYRAGDRHFREIRLDPFFSTLRTDPEFVRIIQQMENDVADERRRVDVNDKSSAAATTRHCSGTAAMIVTEPSHAGARAASPLSAPRSTRRAGPPARATRRRAVCGAGTRPW